GDDLDVAAAVEAKLGDGTPDFLDAERVANAGQLDQAQGDGRGALHVRDLAGKDQLVATQDDPAAAQARHLLKVRITDAREQQEVGTFCRNSMLDRAVFQSLHRLPCPSSGAMWRCASSSAGTGAGAPS